MLDSEFISILRCPKSQAQLREASSKELEKLNTSRKSSDLDQLETALLNESDMIFYPVVNGIPVLLVDEAIQA